MRRCRDRLLSSNIDHPALGSSQAAQIAQAAEKAAGLLFGKRQWTRVAKDYFGIDKHCLADPSRRCHNSHDDPGLLGNRLAPKVP